jgi:hypothetical protein
VRRAACQDGESPGIDGAVAAAVPDAGPAPADGPTAFNQALSEHRPTRARRKPGSLPEGSPASVLPGYHQEFPLPALILG